MEQELEEIRNWGIENNAKTRERVFEKSLPTTEELLTEEPEIK